MSVIDFIRKTRYRSGTGTTSGASLDAQGQDQRCFSSKTGTTDATTVTTKVRSNISYKRFSFLYGSVMEFVVYRL